MDVPGGNSPGPVGNPAHISLAEAKARLLDWGDGFDSRVTRNVAVPRTSGIPTAAVAAGVTLAGLLLGRRAAKLVSLVVLAKSVAAVVPPILSVVKATRTTLGKPSVSGPRSSASGPRSGPIPRQRSTPGNSR